jgi:ABC-type dipeptide/oligopeptide/nickel transport system ATPase component
MAVVNHMCDRVAVMKGGCIVEQGDRDAVLVRPQHEYTRSLLAAVPVAQPRIA